MVATSLMTTFFTFLSLRWLFSKIGESLSGLTHLGAKVAGQAAGTMRATKAVRNEMAEQFLSGPALSGLRMIGSQIGLNIDEMIEEHGAEETLAGAMGILQILGINPQDLLTEGIAGIAKHLLKGGTTSERGSLP